MGKRSPFTARCVDAVILTAAWAFLLRLQNPGLMADDSGEMVAASVGLGIPHPPGYPLVVLLGHLFTGIPLGTAAFRMNLLSAGLALLALSVSFSFLGKSSKPFEYVAGRVLLGLVFFSFRPLVAQALTAKGVVYTLTLLVGVLLAWIWARQGNSVSRGLLMVFVWTVGMTAHWQTVLLWGPWVAYEFLKNKKLWTSRTFLMTCTIGMIGLSVYLFLPLRAIRDCVPSWGYPIHPSLLYWVLSRQLVSQVEHWVQPFCFYQETAAQFLWTGIFSVFPLLWVFFFLGLWRGFREKSVWRWMAVVWGGPVVLAVFLVHESQNIYLVPVYLVSLAAWFAFLVWQGLGWLRGSALLGRWRVPAGWFLAAALCVWSWGTFRAEDKSRYFLAGDLGLNVMKDTPRGSILLAEGDPYVMSIWYQKVAEHKRPDLVFEPAVFLVHGWGWKQLGDQSPEIAAAIRKITLFQERFKALTKGGVRHPLCYSLNHAEMGDALRALPGYWKPLGLVMEWVPTRKALGVPRSLGHRSRLPESLLEDPASAGILGYYQMAEKSLKP